MYAGGLFPFSDFLDKHADFWQFRFFRERFPENWNKTVRDGKNHQKNLYGGTRK